NPDLRPETSDSIEGGLRLRELPLGEARLTASVAGFAGWYRDFIEQRQVSGSFRPTDPAIFQFVNAARVRIHGVEGRADLRLLPQLTARLAGSWTRGTSIDAGTRRGLSSVDPVKLVGGLEWRDAEGRFGAQAVATHSARKRQSRVAETCSPACFTPPAFTTLDVTAFWRPVEPLTVRLGLFNLTDRTYWWWSDVRGLAAASTVLDAYTQPGRTASASATVRF
ncbi:MAG: TonB-dependent receptor domain-containing protein, partial [Sphingomonadaceae bacterium]